MTVYPQQEQRVAPLEAARRHRAELLDTIHAFERALAAPVADPEWRAMVRGRLAALREEFTAHVVVTEGRSGLYAELLHTAPRLARRVAVLTREHAAITAAIEALGRQIEHAEADELRGWASDLLRELSRHRQRGADLVYEAYATDIGGET